VNPVVTARSRKLKVECVQGCEDKRARLEVIVRERGLALDQVAYVGNDVNDLGCFELVGWPTAVANAHDIVKGLARSITATSGGHGAIREIAAWILGPSLSRTPRRDLSQ
jgi:YrbI family 3-deoxy-D-manno-octulosonate 8-phosphate phosphatase